MSFSSYLRYALWDFILVALAAIALAYTLLDGFYIAPALQHGPLPAAIVLVLLVLLYLAGFNKRSMRIGIPAYAVVVVAGLAYAASATQGDLLVDAEQNRFIFAFIVCATATLVYLLARKRVGTALLFIAGSFACCWIQFFYQRYELLWLLVFVVSSIVLVVYRNYQQSAKTATSVKKVSFAAGFGVALAAAAVAVGASAAIWFGIIAPLSPGAFDIKLITEYRALETQQVRGTSSVFLTPNMDMTSDKTNSQSRTTDDLQQSESGTPVPAIPKKRSSSQEQSSGSVLGIDLSSISKAFDFENNAKDAWRNLLILLGVLVAIAAAITAFFLLRRMLRSRRLDRVRAQSPSVQVSELYVFIVSFLKKMGYAVPAGSTLSEFAANNNESLSRFNAEGGSQFAELTDTYVGVAYGGCPVGQAQADRFSSYYRGLWRAARKQLGNVKYLLRSFRL